MPWTPAFHARQPETPPVFHDNSACPEGQKIEPRDRRHGIGNSAVRCPICAELRKKGQ
jgi:hypothetical protein